MRQSVEGTVMKYRPAKGPIVCSHCGLTSVGRANHANLSECVAALQCEVNQLREHLRHRGPSAAVVSQRRDETRPCILPIQKSKHD